MAGAEQGAAGLGPPGRRQLEAEIERLRASEAQWRAIFQNMHEGFALCEIVRREGRPVDFRYVELNAAWERLTGVAPEKVLGRLGSEAFPGLEPFWAEIYAQVVETGEPVHFEARIDAVERWFEVFAYRVSATSFAALFLNITQRREAETRHSLLARELDHRAKNSLAVVQAALRLTRAADLPSYVTAIIGRVDALARAQSVLAEGRWSGADLEALLDGELAPFRDADHRVGPRALLRGPKLIVPATMAQPLAMALHELAMNAVKHGALSMPEGCVLVRWQVRRSGGRGGRMLCLRWTEAGGPPVVQPPQRIGFGTRLLERTVRAQMGGAVMRRWRRDGLACLIRVPLRPEDADGPALVAGSGPGQARGVPGPEGLAG